MQIIICKDSPNATSMYKSALKRRADSVFSWRYNVTVDKPFVLYSSCKGGTVRVTCGIVSVSGKFFCAFYRA